MITITTRNFKDGNLLYYPSMIESDLTLLKQKFNLTPTLLTIVSEIITLFDQRDSDNVVPVRDLSEKLNLTSRQITYYFAQLVKLKLLNQQGYSLVNQSSGRNSLFEVSLTVDDSLLTEEINQIKVEKPKSSRAHHALIKSKFGLEQNLDLDNTHIVRNQTQYPFEQLLANNAEEKKNIAGYIYVKSIDGFKEVAAKASSSSRIVNSDDIQTLYALISLTIGYHTLMQSKYKREKSNAINETVIFLNEILKIRKLAKGGNQYIAIRKSIQAFGDTVYDFNSLNTFEWFDKSMNMFATERFRILEATPLSEEEAKIIDGEYVENPTAYAIKWNDNFFLKLMSDKEFFVFPKESLAVPSLLFLVYLHLRNVIQNKYSENKPYSNTLKHLNSRINKDTDFPVFLKNLRKSFSNSLTKKYCKTKHDPINDVYKLNLFGFVFTINFVEEYFYAYPVIKEMLEALGLNSTTKTAPIIENPMYDFTRSSELLYNETNTDVTGSTAVISRAYPTGFDVEAKLIKGISAKKRKFITVISVGLATKYVITYYDSDQHCFDISSAAEVLLQNKSTFNKIFAYILSLRDTIKPLDVQGEIIEKETINSLINEMNVESDDVDVVDVINFFSRRIELRKALLRYQSDKNDLDFELLMNELSSLRY